MFTWTVNWTRAVIARAEHRTRFRKYQDQDQNKNKSNGNSGASARPPRAFDYIISCTYWWLITCVVSLVSLMTDDWSDVWTDDRWQMTDDRHTAISNNKQRSSDQEVKIMFVAHRRVIMSPWGQRPAQSCLELSSHLSLRSTHCSLHVSLCILGFYASWHS